MPRLKLSRNRVRHGNYLGTFSLVIAVLLAVSGCLSIIHGLRAQRQVSETKNLGDIPAAANVTAAGNYLPFAQPVTLRIPAIQVASVLVTVGKTADGHIDTPHKPYFDHAAWYTFSPTPGQYGASVIVGHVDSYDNNNGASVFYNLAKLRPGDSVLVDRSDNTTAEFTIYATRKYNRQQLPSNQVYTVHTNDAELRLITCAGTFDTKTAEYDSNTVIFARLASSHKTG